jgi:hypothetical protein
MGLAFQGPFSLITLLLFRIIGLIYNQVKFGNPINFKNSSFFDQNKKF